MGEQRLVQGRRRVRPHCADARIRQVVVSDVTGGAAIRLFEPAVGDRLGQVRLADAGRTVDINQLARTTFGQRFLRRRPGNAV